jgi:hypothetical protein
MGLGQEGSVAGPAGNSGDNPGMQSYEENIVGRQEDGVVEDVHLGDESSQADSMDTTELEMAPNEWGDEEENSKLPSVQEMTAIPEASPEQSSARRSKRRAGEADEDVSIMSERRKALRNDGTAENPSLSFNVADSVVISNLDGIGISLGPDQNSINESVCTLKCKATSCDKNLLVEDRKTLVLEKGGK